MEDWRPSHPEEKAKVMALLESNRDCFAFSLEELGTSNNTPMELPLDTSGSIFQGSHKLSQTEWDFVETNCKKLHDLGMIRPSSGNTKY